jgi:hypothetical protein
MTQIAAIAAKIKAGKVKNIYAAKAKIKKIKKARAHFEWLAQ